jgi:hypothetical protein
MKKIFSIAAVLGIFSMTLANATVLKEINPRLETYLQTTIDNMPQQNLSDEEINSLIKMRQEEKLARDVYLTLYDKYQVRIFLNIANAENVHMSQIKILLDKYNIDDPIQGIEDTVGEFADSEFGELYNQLVQEGNQSYEDALKVGATIEDLDIKDLDDEINSTDNDDIKFVYSNLRRGSTHHMKAFVYQLERLGYDYAPQYISDEEYEEIINN